jgi:hypothetical protein
MPITMPLSLYRLLPLALLCAFLPGCVFVGDKLDEGRYRLQTLPYYVFDNAQGWQNPSTPSPLRDQTNVVLAISGGGSRSAVFAAGVMEQLAHIPDPRTPGKSVLENTRVISAVSGGSVAGAYYTLYKPDRFVGVDDKAKFFQQFIGNMTTDFNVRGFVHYVTHPWEGVLRYYTRYKFGPTLSNTFDDFLFQGATFDNLLERERSGTSPHLILNATDLNTGRRFVFTNLNTSRQMSLSPTDAGLAARSANGSAGITALARVAAAPMFQPKGFDQIDSDIGIFRIATAVTASSAYPVVPGPISLVNYATIQRSGKESFVHVGDGGTTDNYGVDSLLSLYFSQVAQGRGNRRLVIIGIDAVSGVGGSRDQDPDGYVSALGYAARAYGSLVIRSETYSRSLMALARPKIEYIPISIAEHPNARVLRGSTASFSIPERDMHALLDAARDLVRRKTPEIRAAIAGRRGLR